MFLDPALLSREFDSGSETAQISFLVTNSKLSLAMLSDEGSALQLDHCVMMRSNPVFRILGLSCLALAQVCSLADGAGAQSFDEAQAAYVDGRFIDAVRIAEALGTSEGYALAAQSLTIHAYFVAGEDQDDALFERAIELAEDAIRSDPDNADAYLQLARAVGRHAQTMGSFEAANRGYAERIEEATKTALRLDPDMAAAHVSLGLWNAELVGVLGSFMARLTFGARRQDALSSFKRAIELAPNEKAVPLQYALGLLVLDKDKYGGNARALLKRSINLPAKNAYDRLLHKQAVDRLEALETSGG